MNYIPAEYSKANWDDLKTYRYVALALFIGGDCISTIIALLSGIGSESNCFLSFLSGSPILFLLFSVFLKCLFVFAIEFHILTNRNIIEMNTDLAIFYGILIGLGVLLTISNLSVIFNHASIVNASILPTMNCAK